MMSKAKKLTKIEFFPKLWDGTQYKFKLAENGLPATILIDPTTIVSMDDKPSCNDVYSPERSGPALGQYEMYLIQTNIVSGYGVKDSLGFWVTKKTYDDILEKFVEIV